jgi:leucyl-tRNA synthetase
VDLEKIESGLEFRNIKAVHPLTGEELPVFVCTYVLSDYGTGAIMGVPLHDERDCIFAIKNNLQMTQVIDGDEENNLNECTLCNSGKFSGLKVHEAA